MRPNKLLRLINRTQADLEQVKKEVEENIDVMDTEECTELEEVRLRLQALEVRVSAIEEGRV